MSLSIIFWLFDWYVRFTIKIHDIYYFVMYVETNQFFASATKFDYPFYKLLLTVHNLSVKLNTVRWN